MRILLLLFSLFLFIPLGLSQADEISEIRVPVLPANVGLAMVKMMETSVTAEFTTRFELGGFKKAPGYTMAGLIRRSVDISWLNDIAR
jgi:hypothetical protein